MDRQCENARKIVSFLQSHPLVKDVFYPGDFKNQDYFIASKQMKKGGGVFAFTIDGTKEETQEFINHLEMIKIAVSLGDTETLVQHPATMTHAVVPKELREKMGITENMLRMSVGLEAWEDIVADLQQALLKSSSNTLC
jgi:methionine-gamma-lyase